MSSKLPTAKTFRKWVTSEVLPTIRKTGSYSIVNLSNDVEERRLKIEEGKLELDQGKLKLDQGKLKLSEIAMLKELTELDNSKMKQTAIDELINMIGGQKQITCDEPKWSRDIVTLCKDELNKRIDFSEASKLGAYIKNKYVAKYKKNPDKYDKFVNGNTRKVNAYQISVEKDLIRWIKQYYL